MNKHLLAALREIRRDLEIYPLINRGGCAIFAAIITDVLLKNGIPAEVVTVGPAYDDEIEEASPKQVRERLKGKLHHVTKWDELGLQRDHLGVRFRWRGRLYTFDSDALRKSGQYLGIEYDCIHYPFGHGATVQETLLFHRYVDGWNDRFNRRHVPHIRAIIYESFTRFGFSV